MRTSFFYRMLILILVVVSCSSSDDGTTTTNPGNSDLYFPPIGSSEWDTQSISDLNWNEAALNPLLDFLENSNTRAFIILSKGHIITENYFNGADSNTSHPWFSAGKTLTAFMTGIAQEEGFLNLSDSSADYLGQGWTLLTETDENNITVLDHLRMTTGLDYTLDFTCTDKECLDYLNPSGTFWYYHNAPYTLTQSIISNAINSPFETYFNTKLRDPIGMQGLWVPLGYNNFYFSNARSMARFGLLCLNEGLWDEEVILGDTNYFKDMTSTSQNLNKAYGYLWWLNGKESFRIPASTTEFNGLLIPNAPDDLIAGLGANDQKLYVIPSKDLVIVRLGGDGGSGELGPSGYDNELWSYLSALID